MIIPIIIYTFAVELLLALPRTMSTALFSPAKLQTIFDYNKIYNDYF